MRKRFGSAPEVHRKAARGEGEVARAESHGYRSAGPRERRSRKYGLTLTRLQRRFRDACVKK